MSGLARPVLARAARLSGAEGRLAKAAFADSFAIAMYHGLSERRLAVPEWCIVEEAAFRRQMQYLAAHFTVVHVEDAAAVAATRPRRPVAAITFDDGFASVHDLAWPVLRELGLPATVYLVTDLVGTARTVWFAELHHAITETSVPSIAFGGVDHPLGDPSAKRQASSAIQLALKALPAVQLEQEVDGLLDRLHADRADFRRIDHFRILTPAEVRAMAATGLVRFGGHTTDHRILTKVPAAEVRPEVEQSIAAANRFSGAPCSSFAYPNGGEQDFDGVAVDALRAARIDWAVTTVAGPNGPDSDPYRLRRYGVGTDDSLDVFAWRMHHTSARVQLLRGRLTGRARHQPRAGAPR